MHNKHVKIFLLMAAALAVSLIVLSGCGNTEMEGQMPENSRPKCYISNIPVEGQEYSKNPTLYWFATDEDGFIKRYRYIVKRAEDINNDPLAYAESILENGDVEEWTVIWTDSLTPGKSATSDTIQLFADADPAVYTPQYFFVQALDNEDLPSNFTDTVDGKITALAYRLYSRNNNPPETHMVFDTAKVYFSLPDTTETYGGVTIAWSGSDSLDYKRTQPPFQYHWKVYGPFDTREEANSSDAGKFVYESYDSATQSVWVSREAAVLFDFYRKQPSSTSTRAKYFLFEVAARDDAFVSDPTPAAATIYVVEPGFERGLLLIDNNSYTGQNFTYTSWVRTVTRTDTTLVYLQNYYKSLFQQAGYVPDYFYYYLQSNPYNPVTKRMPSLDTLLQFKYIVLLNENSSGVSNAEDSIFKYLADYMDLGGRVMFVGWNTFATVSGMNRFSPSDFAYKYFGVATEFKTSWDENGETYGPNFGITPEEMIRAEAIVTDMPAILEVDTLHMKHYYIKADYGPYTDTTYRYKYDNQGNIIDIDTTVTVKRYGNTYYMTSGAEPWVGYYIKSTAAEAVYTSKSVYSSKAIFGHDQREFMQKFPNMEMIDGRVCGVRLKTDVYRSQTYGFSLYCMPQEQAVDFIRAAMDWLTAVEDEEQ